MLFTIHLFSGDEGKLGDSIRDRTRRSKESDKKPDRWSMIVPDDDKRKHPQSPSAASAAKTLNMRRGPLTESLFDPRRGRRPSDSSPRDQSDDAGDDSNGARRGRSMTTPGKQNLSPPDSPSLSPRSQAGSGISISTTPSSPHYSNPPSPPGGLRYSGGDGSVFPLGASSPSLGSPLTSTVRQMLAQATAKAVAEGAIGASPSVSPRGDHSEDYVFTGNAFKKYVAPVLQKVRSSLLFIFSYILQEIARHPHDETGTATQALLSSFEALEQTDPVVLQHILHTMTSMIWRDATRKTDLPAWQLDPGPILPPENLLGSFLLNRWINKHNAHNTHSAHNTHGTHNTHSSHS